MSVNEKIQRALESAGLLRRLIKVPRRNKGSGGNTRRHHRPADGLAPGSSAAISTATPGQFFDRSYTNAAGTRAYKLYVPQTDAETPKPLVVMLHGCTQTPDDFAAGTDMNQLADQEGFLVVYPAQSAGANGMKCWNWFNANDQVRDRGEPSLIAGIVRAVASECNIDEQRIFVAGLSAGAAMAVIMGATYPELFAAVGVHSGLPYGAARGLTSAFAAMRGGGEAPVGVPEGATSVPTIVFHGDNDKTVNAGNGSGVVDQAVSLSAASAVPLQKMVQERTSANGREFTATVYHRSDAQPVVEHWVLHGAGHAWSGGSSNGSYTDETGPRASAEMVRFFLAQDKKA